MRDPGMVNVAIPRDASAGSKWLTEEKLGWR